MYYFWKFLRYYLIHILWRKTLAWGHIISITQNSWIDSTIYWELISLGIWHLKYWSFSELCSSTVSLPEINTQPYRSRVSMVPLQPGDQFDERSKAIGLKQCATNADFLRGRQEFDGVETAPSTSKRSVIWNLEGSQTGKWTVPPPNRFNCLNFICDSTHAFFFLCLFKLWTSSQQQSPDMASLCKRLLPPHNWILHTCTIPHSDSSI